jgi:hypothetical protein
MTPLEKWKQGLEAHGVRPKEPKDEERFRQDFLCFVEPDGTRVIERAGVHFKDLVYDTPELAILSSHIESIYDDNKTCNADQLPKGGCSN